MTVGFHGVCSWVRLVLTFLLWKHAQSALLSTMDINQLDEASSRVLDLSLHVLLFKSTVSSAIGFYYQVLEGNQEQRHWSVMALGL